MVNQIKLQSQLNDHQRENALIFSQILSTYSLKKCMEISLENLLVIILGLKGLRMPSLVYTGVHYRD